MTEVTYHLTTIQSTVDIFTLLSKWSKKTPAHVAFMQKRTWTRLVEVGHSGKQLGRGPFDRSSSDIEERSLRQKQGRTDEKVRDILRPGGNRPDSTKELVPRTDPTSFPTNKTYSKTLLAFISRHSTSFSKIHFTPYNGWEGNKGVLSMTDQPTKLKYVGLWQFNQDTYGIQSPVSLCQPFAS